MLGALVRFSLEQRLVILLFMVIILAGGWYAFREVPIDAFPDVSTTQVKIVIKAPGMTPAEVESRITALVEVEMLGIPNQVMLRSISKYALADITVDFTDNTDIYWARQQVSERLNAIWSDLPPDIEGGLAPITTPLSEMFMFTISGGGLTLKEHRDLLDWVIRPALRTIPGVADVNSLGGYVRTYEVIPDNAALNSHGVTFDQLQQALLKNNQNAGAGRLEEGEESLLVRTEGSIDSLNDIAAIVVKSHPYEPVHVRDVAEIRLGSLTRYGAVTHSGQAEIVQGLVLGLRGANAKQLIAGVKNKLEELKPRLPEGVNIDVFYDRSILVDRAIHTVSRALIEAVVLVLILLVLLLGNLRAALTVAFILPTACLTTFILMYYFDISANLMSLGGLAIAIGMLVDAAVVVVENIVNHINESHGGNDKPVLHLVYRSVEEVLLPVTTGILIIMVVFLPLLTLQGLEGKLFTPVAITIIMALGASLLLSMTVIPVLASFLLKKGSHRDPFIIRYLRKAYSVVLQWSLRNSMIVILSSAVLLIFSIVIYFHLGKIFLPTMDEGNIIIQTEKIPSINLENSIEMDMRVQQELMQQVPDVKQINARTGSDELGLDPMGLNQTDMFLVLDEPSKRQIRNKDLLITSMREVLQKFPGLVYAFTQPIEMRVSEMLTGVRGDVAIKIFGSELDQLNQLAESISGIVGQINGAEDVYTTQNDGVQYYSVRIDRQALGRFGINVNDFEEILRAQIEGRQLGLIYEEERRVPLIIRGDKTVRQSPAEFANLMLTLPNGRNVPISMFAELVRTEGPVLIQRERGRRISVVIANVSGRDLVGFVEEAKQKVAEQINLPPNYFIEWGGQFENQQRAAARLTLVIPVSIALIFILLFSTFHSLRQSVLVLSNIPFAMVGGILSLWISGEYLSVPASVGFIALLGIAVLNGVVLLGHFNDLRAKGMEIQRVVVEGAQRRLRPVLMTASIAASALIPLLFASGPGSEIQRPLAIVVIGGLITSTVLTLILLPILYRRFCKPV